MRIAETAVSHVKRMRKSRDMGAMVGKMGEGYAQKRKS